MKIAQIAPIVEKVPPEKYGGTERVVSALTEELVRRGHDVTLFASGDSKTSATLASVVPKALKNLKLEDPFGLNEHTLLHIGHAYQRQNEFDILHDHVTPTSVPTASIATTPTVLTMHRPFTDTEGTALLFENLKDLNLVTISNAQARMLKDKNSNIIGTVYNGLQMKEYPFSSAHKGYLLFVGRLSARKGPHLAIKVAQNLGLPLILAAKLQKPDKPYFEKFIKPHLSKKIRWVGEVDEKKRNALMAKALCVLHPVTWPEPFGLTMIEAMACGAPVIGFNLGSIPEVIADGQTGFVVKTLSQMIQAVKKINQIDRNNCRAHVLKNFSVEKMVDQYEEIYRALLTRKLGQKITVPVFPPSQGSPILRSPYTAFFAHDITKTTKLKLNYRKDPEN
jgi:glycosyltransferase involved in cell wall biosynthesis